MKKKIFKPVIGLEIHSELKTKSKMFCSCPNDFNSEPNKNICPLCLGHPGTLPVINQEAVKQVIKAGLALNCEIAEVSKFDRKNYFYPDLPKGYQISQYDMPFCKNGFLKINNKKIRIRRIHLEEDAGKLIHTHQNYSLVDFNRAGVPLMELVTEPDIYSAEEAISFAKELQLILRYLDISEADMEKGQMRIEVNISLSQSSGKPDLSGTRIEVKNLNSFKSVEGAIEYEIKRQSRVLEKGKKIIQATRGWDADKRKTIDQRKKEDAHDYRYLPEPDLLPLIFSKEDIESIRKDVPELPQEKRIRFKNIYQLKEDDVEFFIQNIEIGSFFERVIDIFNKKKKKNFNNLVQLTANYLISDLQGLLNQSEDIEEILFSPDSFAEFIQLINSKEISSKIAKKVLAKMFRTGKKPSLIIKKEGLKKMNDKEEINEVVQKVFKENSKAVSDFRSGKENAFNFLIGQVMAKTRGRANLEKVKKVLKEELKN